jgi:hypothetical protein
MTFFRNTSLLSIADLITELETRMTTAGWTSIPFNNVKTVPSGPQCLSYERVWRIPGSALQPTACFVDLHRVLDSLSVHGLGAMCFTGARSQTPNRALPVAISVIAKNFAGLVTVTTALPHGFATNDLVILNGTVATVFGARGADTFNEGTNNEGGPALITVTGPSTFTYTSAFTSIVESGSGGQVMAVWSAAGSRYVLRNDLRAGGIITLLDGAMQVFGYIDEFRCMFTVKQGGNWRTMFLGQTGRRHVQADFSDTAFSSGALAAGLGVTINLVDSVGAPLSSPNLCVGQKIWLIDPTTGRFEPTTILTKPLLTQITCDIVFSYNADGATALGPIVGLDPMPVGVLGNHTPNLNLSSIPLLMTHFENASRPTAVNGHATTQTYSAFADFGGAAVSMVSPDANGDYQGQDIAVQRTAAPSGMRANLAGSGAIAFGVNVQTDGDLQRVGCLPTVTDYMILVSQQVALPVGVMALAYGPGAA